MMMMMMITRTTKYIPLLQDFVDNYHRMLTYNSFTDKFCLNRTRKKDTNARQETERNSKTYKQTRMYIDTKSLNSFSKLSVVPLLFVNSIRAVFLQQDLYILESFRYLCRLSIIIIIIIIIARNSSNCSSSIHSFPSLSCLSSPCSPYNRDKQIIFFLFRSEIRKQARSCSALRTGDVFQATRIKVQGQLKGWQFIDDAGDYQVSVRNLIHTVG